MSMMQERLEAIGSPEKEKIRAEYLKSIFESERMIVAIYKASGNGSGMECFKVTGSGLITNRPCILIGNWKTHPKYGKTFVAIVSEDVPAPDKVEGYADYLKDMKLKGLGEKTAQRIVAMYGEGSLAAMEDPEKLVKIKGISPKKAIEIVKDWKSREGLRKYYDFFTEIGLAASKSASAYKQMEKDGYDIDEVRQNPYLLCHCERLSFPEVDNAVLQCADGNYFYEYKDRVYYGLLYSMVQMEKSGHSYVHYAELTNRAMKLLFPRDNGKSMLLRYYFMEMVRDGSLIYEKENDAIYREHTYKAENGSAELLGSLLLAPRKNADPDKIKKMIRDSDPKGTLSGKQGEAVLNAFLQNVSIITGGPGMGKTYCLKAILAVANKLAEEKHTAPMVALCAPTGRAARKMEENAKHPASTIHHLLCLTDDGVFASRPEQIEADIVVVDEFSMVGIELFYSLLRCIRPGTTLIIIGDKDQLESVPCGNVLNDLIKCGNIPVTILDKIFRQEEGCSIVENAYAVNNFNGDIRALTGIKNILRTDKDTRFIPVRNDQDCLNEILSAAKSEAEKFGHENVQILTPLRKRTEVCSRVLNARLQALFNPPSNEKIELKRGEKVFREGDRVMQLKNVTDGSTYYSNGDIGIISKIVEREKTVWVTFDEDRVRTYENTDLDELDHAYALTVHKAQGSEFDSVIIPFISDFAGMRKKKILYTAMTRAKKRLTMIGDEGSVIFALDDKGDVRNSLLGWRFAKNVHGRGILNNTLKCR